MNMKKSNSEGVTKIHNVRFYNLSPRSIMCMAYNRKLKKLALSRSDASIEIWNMNDAPFLERTLGETSNASVEGLGWCGTRLFSAGIYGTVIEWDVAKQRVKQTQYATGNSIWCLDVNSAATQIALGTEGGFLNIFDIDETELSNQRLFDKQDGRILCCKFDATGNYIVTGSIDVIRIWNVQAGHALHKLNVGRNLAKKSTIVWSLLILKNFQIVSGDSRGQVTIWDGNMGAQVETHQVLKADVLTLAANEEENILICSGIDPIIRIFALAEIKKNNELHSTWVKFLQRSVHDHDVKSIICADGKIFSGGLDGYLGVSSYTKNRQFLLKYGPFLKTPCASVAEDARLILLRYPTYLEIWRLGSAENTITDKLKLRNGPEKLLELLCKSDEIIVCSSISPNGCWLAYSTATKIRLFNFTPGSNKEPKSKLIRVKDVHETFRHCLRILFSHDSKTIFIVKINKDIEIYSILPNGEMDHKQTLSTGKHVKQSIHLIAVSKCGRYLITAGLCRTIAVWFREKSDFKHHFNLPQYYAQTTALAIHSNKPHLVVAFADSKIFEYNIDEMCFTCSDKDNFVANLGTHCVNNILLDARNPNVFIMQNNTNMFVLEKISNTNNSKLSKKPLIVNSEHIDKLKLKFSKSYEHCVHMDWLANNELVVVEINPLTLIEQLPSALKQKKFGAS